MKNIIISTILLFSTVISAQNLSSKDEAIKAAIELVNSTNGLKFEASKLFTEENKFVVKFTQGNNYVLVAYNHLISETEDSFVFVSVTGSYDDMILIWNRFSNTSKEKYFDKINNVVYYFYEDNDDRWIVSKHDLK